MSAAEVRDRLSDRFRLLTRPEYDRIVSHPAPSVAWSFDLLDDTERTVLGTASVFAGGFDLPSLCAVAAATDDIEVLGLLDSWSASPWSSPTTAPPGRATACSRPSGRSPTSSSRGRRTRPATTGMLLTSGSEAAARWERWNGPDGMTRWTGCRRSWPTCAPPSGGAGTAARSTVATDVAAHAALMGFSVELFETIGWAEALLEEATQADVRRLPRLYAAAGYACFVGRAAAATAHAHRATELEPTPATSRASPATRGSSRRSGRSTTGTWLATSS